MFGKNWLVKGKTFLYAALSNLKINLGGQLGANEILAIIDGLSLKSWKQLYREVPDIKKINIAYTAVLVSQMLSDLVNHSSLQNLIRGWANIAMAIVVTNFLVKMLWKRNDAIVLYLCGMIISMLLFGPESEGATLEDMSFFKFKLAPILNCGVMLLSWYLIRRSSRFQLSVALLLCIYGLFNIVFDSRSNGTVFLIISILLYRRNLFRRLSWKRILPYMVVFAVVGQAVYSFYVSQVLAGKIGGKHAEEQFEQTKNPYNPINLLMAGRSEVYVALTAIKDSPIFGHGSWAPDPGGKYTYMIFMLHGEEDKFEEYLRSDGEAIIPSHSVIFGIWVTAGVGGFIGIMYVLFLFYRRGNRLLKVKAVRESPYFPLLLLYLVSSIWTFLFSPLPHIKQSLPIEIAFVIVLFRKMELKAIYELTVNGNRWLKRSSIRKTVPRI